MKRIFTPTHPAYLAPIAMENLFFLMFIIKEITFLAKICGKFNLAFFAWFLRFLNMITIITFNLFYFMPIDFMIIFLIFIIIVFDLIMANSARIELLAVRTLDLTFSLVMLATFFWVYILNLLLGHFRLVKFLWRKMLIMVQVLTNDVWLAFIAPEWKISKWKSYRMFCFFIMLKHMRFDISATANFFAFQTDPILFCVSADFARSLNW